MADKVRFTISVEPDVHEAFAAMAEASGQSLSRVVGDWLRDTTEAARFVSDQVTQLRKTPVQVLQDLAGKQESAVMQTRALVAGLQAGRIKLKVPEAEAGRATGRRRPPGPPCSPTGVKDSRKGAKP